MEHVVASWNLRYHVLLLELCDANYAILLFKVILMRLEKGGEQDIIKVFKEFVDDQLFLKLKFD